MKEILETLVEGQVVLDLGAGEGSFRYAGIRATVLAMDLSFSRKADPEGLHIIGDAAAIPLADGCVDLVICNNTLEHFEGLDRTLAEIERVLKPVGVLWASVPDARSFDDRFYRFLFAGGGHVNQFTLESFLGRVQECAGLQPQQVQTLHTGFVFLNPPDTIRLKHYPLRARFLGWVPSRVLRRAIRWLNLLVRVVDRRFGGCLSQYGWALTMAREPREDGPRTVPTHINVCFGCGGSSSAGSLIPRPFLFWKVYNCPDCAEINFWFPDPGSSELPAAAGGQWPGQLPSGGPAPVQAEEHPSEARLRRVAETIFGEDDSESVQRWVDFWGSARPRASFMLDTFQALALMKLTDQRVLDVGCGTGGMGDILEGRCRCYAGVDPTGHVIRLATPRKNTHFIEASGTALPFPDDSFDYVFALDVLEHVQGALDDQVAFLNELRRVVTPVGMICLSTPNRLYPYEGHTGLFFPQYLPKWLRHLYIRRFNPGFLKEHASFSEITSLTPAALQRSLKKSNLAFLHQLPCGLDRSDFIRHFPIRGLLGYLGLGWYPHAEFWGILVGREMRDKLRLKLPKCWTYEQRQPSPTGVVDFGCCIDFERGFYNPQLGPGWYWQERDRLGFRWIAGKAICFLQTDQPPRLLNIHGYGPRETRLLIRVNGLLVGVREIDEGTEFRLIYLVPFEQPRPDIWRIELECTPTFAEHSQTDPRQLGVMIFTVEMKGKVPAAPSIQMAFL